MKRRTKIILWIYLVGFAICELLLLWGTYDSGGFQRHHTLTTLVVITGYHLVAGALWPIVAIIGTLQYFGFLPHPITF
jgi:hypothetical protein